MPDDYTYASQANIASNADGCVLSQAGREDTQARYTLGDVSCTLSVKGNWTADEDEEDAAEADPEKVSASLMSLSVEDRFAVMSSIIRKSLDPTGDIVRVRQPDAVRYAVSPARCWRSLAGVGVISFDVGTRGTKNSHHRSRAPQHQWRVKDAPLR